MLQMSLYGSKQRTRKQRICYCCDAFRSFHHSRKNFVIKRILISNKYFPACWLYLYIYIFSFRLFDESGTITSSYPLSTSFNDPSPLVNDPTFIDSSLRGILFKNMETVDDLFTDEMWNKLFRFYHVYFSKKISVDF